MKNNKYLDGIIDRIAIVKKLGISYLCMIICVTYDNKQKADDGKITYTEKYDYYRYEGIVRIIDRGDPSDFTMAISKGPWTGDIRTLTFDDIEEDYEKL